LRARDPELRDAYWQRGNRQRSWSEPLRVGPLSHVQDAESGLPADIERAVRLAFLADHAHRPRYRRLAVDELDEAGRAAWDAERPELARQMCRQRVIGLLDTPLDPTLVAAVTRRYGLVFLAASDEEPSAELRDSEAFQALDPSVDPDNAAEANTLYLWARRRLEAAER
jgi:hypothetical protein